jgi:predicted nuclease of predicted toxin-antitoxin system
VRVWIDAQLPPALAAWLRDEQGADAVHLVDLGMLKAADSTIFAAASAEQAVVVTKDSDFLALLRRHGPPPQMVWIRSGNTTNRELRRIILAAWPRAADLLAGGEPLVEIRRREDVAN